MSIKLAKNWKMNKICIVEDREGDMPSNFLTENFYGFYVVRRKGKFYCTISHLEKKMVVNIYSEKMVFAKFMVLPAEIYTPIAQNDRKHLERMEDIYGRFVPSG